MGQKPKFLISELQKVKKRDNGPKNTNYDVWAVLCITFSCHWEAKVSRKKNRKITKYYHNYISKYFFRRTYYVYIYQISNNYETLKWSKIFDERLNFEKKKISKSLQKFNCNKYYSRNAIFDCYWHKSVVYQFWYQHLKLE